MDDRRRSWLAATLAGLLWGAGVEGIVGVALVFLGAWIALFSLQGRGTDLFRGAWFGLLWHGISLSWFPGTWKLFHGQDGAGMFGLLLLLQALVPMGVFGLAGALVRRKYNRGLSMGLAWVVGEGALAFTPLPGGPSHLITDAPLLLVWASIGGRPLLSAMTGGLLGLPHRIRWSAGIVWVGVGALWLSAPSSGRILRVGIIQPDFGAFELRRVSLAEEREEKMLRLLTSVRAADLLVTPEGAWPSRADPRQLELLRETWEDHHLPPTLLGTTTRRNGAAFNSLLVLDGRGVGDRYDKRLLVPLLEQAWLGFGKTRYRSGDRPPIVEVASTRVGTAICYEDLFDTPLDHILHGRPDWIVATTNDTWSGPGRAARQHLSAARLMAVTSSRWVVRPTISGISAVIDARGRLRWSAPFREGDRAPSSGLAQIRPIHLRSPAWTGHTVGRILTVLTAFFLALALRRVPA